MELHIRKHCDISYSIWLDSLEFSRCFTNSKRALPRADRCMRASVAWDSSAENDVEKAILCAVRTLSFPFFSRLGEDLVLLKSNVSSLVDMITPI
jgi:hypothetical protein